MKHKTITMAFDIAVFIVAFIGIVQSALKVKDGGIWYDWILLIGGFLLIVSIAVQYGSKPK